MSRSLVAFIFAGVLASVFPRDASAQAYITPFAGVTFNGDSPDKALTTGVSLTLMGTVVGLELDLGYTPDFFGEGEGVELIADSNVTTLTGSLLLGVGVGPVRPYGVFGLGLLRSRVDIEDLVDGATTNDIAFSLGGGVIGMLSDSVGLRGDIRYFRTIQDGDGGGLDDLDLAIGNFDFWRASVGLALKF